MRPQPTDKKDQYSSVCLSASPSVSVSSASGDTDAVDAMDRRALARGRVTRIFTKSNGSTLPDITLSVENITGSRLDFSSLSTKFTLT